MLFKKKKEPEFWQIDIEPKPTPRPRQGTIKYGKRKGQKIFHYPPDYQAYKDALLLLVKSLKIPKKDYAILYVTFGVPYPKSTPKYKRIESHPLRMKFDCDNVVKGFKDALEQAGVLDNDSQIYLEHICKLRTNTQGYIRFYLQESD